MTPTHRTRRPILLESGRCVPAGTPVRLARVHRNRRGRQWPVFEAFDGAAPAYGFRCDFADVELIQPVKREVWP